MNGINPSLSVSVLLCFEKSWFNADHYVCKLWELCFFVVYILQFFEGFGGNKHRVACL